MTATTARLALPYPQSTDPNDYPGQMQALAQAASLVITSFSQGVFASRPAAAVAGRLYAATDTGNVYYDTGSAWIQLNLNAATTVTAKGDLLVASGAGALTRIGAGTDGQSLTALAAATNGLQWQSILGMPLALSGAASATRYVGATTSGAPVSGTFAVGDLVVARDGRAWICTSAGSPGTWKAADTAALGLPLGLAGATTATRYVGGTTSGAPSTGTFAVGDFVIGADGTLAICTSAGTPGTWAVHGKSSLARYRNSALQTVANSAASPFTKVVFDTAVRTTGDVTFNSGTNDFTINRAGQWMITPNFLWSSTSVAGGRYMWVSRVGSEATDRLAQHTVGGGPAGIGTALCCTAVDQFSAGETVAVYLFQTSGGNLASDPTAKSVNIALTWLGP